MKCLHKCDYSKSLRKSTEEGTCERNQKPQEIRNQLLKVAF